jgi:hypothetical protein
LFTKFNILMLSIEFIFLIVSFVVHHVAEFETNSDVHNVSRGRRYDVLGTDVIVYKKGIYYAGIKLFITL